MYGCAHCPGMKKSLGSPVIKHHKLVLVVRNHPTDCDDK
jgi:hypothetical protein